MNILLSNIFKSKSQKVFNFDSDKFVVLILKKKKIRNFFAFFLFTVVSKFSFGFLYFCAKQVQHFVCVYFPTSFHFISDLFSFFSFFFLSSEITGGVVKNQFFILKTESKVLDFILSSNCQFFILKTESKVFNYCSSNCL